MRSKIECECKIVFLGKSMKSRSSAVISFSVLSLFVASSILLFSVLMPTSAALTNSTPVFNAAFNLSNDKGNAMDPMDANSGSHVYVVWTEGHGGILFRTSSDNGSTWTPVLTSSPKKLSLGGTNMQYPVIQANASNVYVAWTQTVNGFQQIYFTSGTNYGSTFSTPTDVDGNTTTQCVTPVIGSWEVPFMSQWRAEAAAASRAFRMLSLTRRQEPLGRGQSHSWFHPSTSLSFTRQQKPE